MVIQLTGKVGGVTELPYRLAQILIEKGLAVEVHPEEKPKSVRTRPVSYENAAHNRTNKEQRNA